MQNVQTKPRTRQTVDEKAATVARIDYSHLAKLEKIHGVPFEELCARAEAGATTDAELLSGRKLHPATDTWLLQWQACAVLGMSEGNFYSTVARNGHYSGVRWKSRSKIKAGAKRGCGVLFHRDDLERLRDVKRAAGVSWMAAAKVFHAMQRGDL